MLGLQGNTLYVSSLAAFFYPLISVPLMQVFFIKQSVKADELADWLEGVKGDELGEWVGRLEVLGQLSYGKLSRVAAEIAGQVMRVEEVAESNGAENGDLPLKFNQTLNGNVTENQAKDTNLSVRLDQSMKMAETAKLNQPDDEDSSNEIVMLAFLELGNRSHMGDRSEEAIAFYDKALKIKPDSRAWNGRGASLSALGREEEAIADFNKALKIKPNDHYALHNRGNALSSIGRKKEAIASYDQALQIKPDLHKTWNDRGNALSEIGREEEAFASYDQALQIKPDQHTAWVNRGISAASLQGYKPVQTIIGSGVFPPIIPSNPSLNQRGWEGQIASYAEGLQHSPKDTHPLGYGFIHRHFGNAHYDRAKLQHNDRKYQDAGSNYHQAISHYTEALTTLTPETYPEDCLKTLQGLIRPLLATGNINDAKKYRLQGLQVLQQLFNAHTSSAHKRRIAKEFIGFSQITIDALVKEGEPIAALEAADRHKNQRLTWILDQWNEQVLSPSYEQMRSLLKNDTAIVYWHYSEETLTIFILTLENAAPIVQTQSTKPFIEWQKEWNKQYQDYRQKGKAQSAHKQNHPWRSLLKNLNTLSDILNIPTITQTLPLTITQLILIPHRDLHRLPLQALFPPAFTTTFLPSLQIGITLQTSPPKIITPNTPLLSLENPNEDLLYSEAEAAIIASQFRHTTRYANTEATLEHLTHSIATHNILHFTGHGTYDDRHPQNSALKLAQDETLTANAISKLDLTPYTLISLASCETSLTGLQTLDRDYVGLSSAFLQAGAANVLGSLWEVRDATHIWLTIRFYQALLDGNTPTQALQISQQAFQTLTPATFIPWLQALAEHLRSLDCGDWETLRDEAIALQDDPDTIDFADPYYWAAFTLTGRGTL